MKKALFAVTIGLAASAHAQTASQPAPVQGAAMESKAFDSAASPNNALLLAMTGPLTFKPQPASFDLSPLGTMYVTGVVSAHTLWQTNTHPSDHRNQVELTNGQVFLNKTDGLVRFFVQAGAYSLPALGLPFVDASQTLNDLYGPVPQWLLKLAPSEDFSIMVGKLPTLIGAEYTFSFENINVQRGLLRNQGNSVNRGVQVNYATGPLALAASWNDGFYSCKFSWVTLSAVINLDKENAVTLVAGANTKRTTVSTSATPLYQNNQRIYNVIYTYTSRPWTIQPYIQYTSIPASDVYDTRQKATTAGAALLVNYAFDAGSTVGGLRLAGVNLPVRAEYISSTGSAASGAPNLLYGQGSKAWSVTATPTYQHKIFFVRGEFAYVQARKTTTGLALGAKGNDRSQTRYLLEAGLLF